METNLVTTTSFAISKRTARLLSLFSLFVCFELIALLISVRDVTLSVQMWALLALASSMTGRAVAYMAIGEWIRAPFTKVVLHSSGAGEDVEPLYTDGWLAGLSLLIACPICAGAWSALGLLALYTFFPHVGTVAIYLFSAACVAWFVTRITELIEASTWLVRELNGYYHKKNE